MKFLIDLFKKATSNSPDGDGFRPDQTPDKYNDKIAQLNAVGANQYSKINTQTISRIQKTTGIPSSQANGNTALPG